MSERLRQGTMRQRERGRGSIRGGNDVEWYTIDRLIRENDARVGPVIDRLFREADRRVDRFFRRERQSNSARSPRRSAWNAFGDVRCGVRNAVRQPESILTNRVRPGVALLPEEHLSCYE